MKTKNTPKRNWIAYDKEHLMDIISGMIVPKGKESDNPKPKDIKGFGRIDFAKGGTKY